MRETRTEEEVARLVEQARAWALSEEGRARLLEGQRQADEMIRRLQEARRLPPDWRDFRVTI